MSSALLSRRGAPVPAEGTLQPASSQGRAMAQGAIRTVPWVAPGTTH
jgi:hypothetical protein